MSLGPLISWSLALWITTSVTSPCTPTLSPFLGDRQQQRTSDPIDDKSGSPPQPATPPNPIVNGIYQVGNGVSAPKLIYSVAPSFSKKARKQKIAGSCTVFLVVDQSGEPKHIHIVKSVAEDLSAKQHSAALNLDEEVIKAVRQDRFEPATLEGKPVSVAMTIEVNFQIF